MFSRPARLVQALGHWHVNSQQAARRNALVACTALAERRRELLDVEDFLAARGAMSPAPTTLEVSVVRARTSGE